MDSSRDEYCLLFSNKKKICETSLLQSERAVAPTITELRDWISPRRKEGSSNTKWSRASQAKEGYLVALLAFVMVCFLGETPDLLRSALRTELIVVCIYEVWDVRRPERSDPWGPEIRHTPKETELPSFEPRLLRETPQAPGLAFARTSFCLVLLPFDV
jgi:hypothetical protein